MSSGVPGLEIGIAYAIYALACHRLFLNVVANSRCADS
jgi:hypothetical protein